MIEAGVAAGYVIAWAVRKARRVGGRLDAEVDGVIDLSLERLHEVVATKLSGHPVLQELAEEAEEEASDAGHVSELTRQQVELALKAAARKDEAFGEAVMELVTRLREAQLEAGPAAQGPEALVFNGDAIVKAGEGGIAFGQVAGDVHIARELPDPQRPGRSGH